MQWHFNMNWGVGNAGRDGFIRRTRECRCFCLQSTAHVCYSSKQMETEVNAVKKNVADNIAMLRQARGMTQAELAQLLNYTDKAVSKWERADSIPDITVLKTVADLFNVSLDFLTETHSDAEIAVLETRKQAKNRLSITLVSVFGIWFIATLLFVVFLTKDPAILRAWMVFIIALPVSSVVLLVFSCIWGRKYMMFICISALIWSLLLLIYLLLFEHNYWYIFLLGIPAELITILSSGIQRVARGENR